MRLLSETDRHPKISKNGKVGVLWAILHLSPAKTSGYEMCPMRSKGCTAACLHYSGMQYQRKYQARLKRTHLLMHNRKKFFELLIREIAALERKAERLFLKPCVRLNGTSDLPWENINVPGTGNNIMQMFPSVAFMDYTKRHNRKNLPLNYRLTFSRSEDNDDKCIAAMQNGMNVAVVFHKHLPLTWEVGGVLWPVIDGDEHDYRYGDYDKYEGRVIVGLRAKGKKAREDKSGFVIKAEAV